MSRSNTETSNNFNKSVKTLTRNDLHELGAVPTLRCLSKDNSIQLRPGDSRNYNHHLLKVIV